MATWEVDVKGEPGASYEITVLRATNGHGKLSYGWIGPDKILISGVSHGSWSVTPRVWDKLLKVAAEVAVELTAQETADDR